MKAIILAAGYATRLYPLTRDKAKPLLEIEGMPIIGYIIEQINSLPSVSEIFIITNNKFYQDFKDWLKTISPNKIITIVNDGTLNNDDRLGSVGDLMCVINKFKLRDDLLVIAGDNLFGFNLAEFTAFFNTKSSPVVAVYDLKDKEKVKQKYGVVIMKKTEIIDFQEKPINPGSTIVSTGCYIFPRQVISKIKQYARGKDLDHSGNLVRYLIKKQTVHGYIFNQFWYDIGSHESLAEAQVMIHKLRTNLLLEVRTKNSFENESILNI